MSDIIVYVCTVLIVGATLFQVVLQLQRRQLVKVRQFFNELQQQVTVQSYRDIEHGVSPQWRWDELNKQMDWFLKAADRFWRKPESFLSDTKFLMPLEEIQCRSVKHE